MFNQFNLPQVDSSQGVETSQQWSREMGGTWAKFQVKFILGFPVAQMVEHGASNAKIMGSIPRESKSWSNVKL